jgi:hypothetical protein
MSNQDFFAASVNARRAALQRDAGYARVARQALRAGRRSAKAAGAAGASGQHAHASARDRVPEPARAANATAVCGS